MFQKLSLEFFRGVAQPEPSHPAKKKSKAPSSGVVFFLPLHYNKLLDSCQEYRRKYDFSFNYLYTALKLSCFFFVLIFSVFPCAVMAEGMKILIVEVQTAGTTSSQDYIKIHNPSGTNTDISGYKLRKRSSTGKESSIRVIPANSLIESKGYFIWANSGDGFNERIKADASSSQTLSKDNSIALVNPEGVVIDALSWGESQNPFVEGLSFPENPGAGQQMKRKQENGAFQDTNNNSSDFYLTGSQAAAEAKELTITPLPVSQPTPTPSPHPSLVPTPSPSPPEEKKQASEQEKGIVINEFLPSPLGPDEKEEWIEIFNQNEKKIDISGWQIKDDIGTTNAYTLPETTQIEAKGFLVLYRTTTKIILNNDGDRLILLYPDGTVTDSVSFEKAPEGQSLVRSDAGWKWSFTPTPGNINIITEKSKTQTSPTPTETEETALEKEKDRPGTGDKMAEISLPISKNVSKLTIYLAALGAAAVSATIILLLKKNLSKNKKSLQ